MEYTFTHKVSAASVAKMLISPEITIKWKKQENEAAFKMIENSKPQQLKKQSL